MSRQGYLGGESGHRNFFGGTTPPWRLALLGSALLIFMISTVMFSTAGFIVGILVMGVTALVTSPTWRGSIIERRLVRHRWHERQDEGTDSYRPFDAEEWQALTAAASGADRSLRKAAQRALRSMRELPDGADGMGWLSAERGAPGIAWHAPLGEQPYLSVAWEVDGQIHGIESQRAESRAAEKFGRFLQRFASASSVPVMVQCMTRVLPPDSTLHESWVVDHLQPGVASELVTSYAEVVSTIVRESMIQRHFIVVRWPLDGRLRREARRFGEGKDGWRALVRADIEKITRALTTAGFRSAHPLSARQVAAVILHQQNPGRPLDMVRDVDVRRIGIASHDLPGAYVVEGTDPWSGQDVTWWHRTLQIKSEHMEYTGRGSLWWLDILRSASRGTALTLSFPIWMVPAQTERVMTVRDVTRDLSNQVVRAGRVEDGEAARDLSSAQRRRLDLSAETGAHHQGARWTGYISLSAQSREALEDLTLRVQERASQQHNTRLDPLLGMQSTAAGCAWPFGRGMRAHRLPGRSQVQLRITGSEDQEGL